MNNVILICCTLVLLVATPAVADEKAKVALIEEMLTLTNGEKMMADVLAQQKKVMHDYTSRAAVADPRLNERADVLNAYTQELEDTTFDILTRAMRWETLKPELIRIYSDVFTEEELAASVAFYSTPAGRSLLQKMPELITRSMQIAQKQVEAAMPELQQAIEKVQEKAKKAAERK
jgi:uncharacterized protein